MSNYFFFASDTDEKATNELPADPWCDENNPRVIQFEKISAAAYRIHGGIVKTPCDVRKINILLILVFLVVCFSLSFKNNLYHVNIFLAKRLNTI